MSISNYIDEYGIDETVKAFSEVIEKRVYYKVEGFKITKKRAPLVLPAIAYFGDNVCDITEAFYHSIDMAEREIRRAIPRKSNITVQKLSENLEKLLVKNSYEFGIQYGKELLLRDPEEFFRVLERYVLLDDITSEKALLLRSFKKIGNYSDEYLVHLFSYLTKMPSNFREFEIKSQELTPRSLQAGVALRRKRKLIPERRAKIKERLLALESYVYGTTIDISYESANVLAYTAILLEQELDEDLEGVLLTIIEERLDHIKKVEAFEEARLLDEEEVVGKELSPINPVLQGVIEELQEELKRV